MKTAESIAWFKRTFGDRIAAGIEGTPFSVDLIAAVANQETGYIWGPLVTKGVPDQDILRLCVGDTLDADRGRSCFPRNKGELLAAARGREMFAIARAALLEMAHYVSGYQFAIQNPNKFCHGYGIFQYDIQFFKENPDYFLSKSWGDFGACLAQFVTELKQAAARQGWARKAALTDEEKVYVAIAYNKGTADCTRGFKQGYKSDDGRCYGENILEFLRVAQAIPAIGAAPGLVRPAAVGPVQTPVPIVFKKRGAIYEVVVQQGPLRLRSAPSIPADDPGSNVLARLPGGQLVQRVSTRKRGDFIEVETGVDGATVRGFASAKFLRRVKRAILVKAAKADGGQSTASPLIPDPESDPTIGMDIDELIRGVQAKLGLEVDGKAGPDTWKAIYRRVVRVKPMVSTPTAVAGTAGGAASLKLIPLAATDVVDPRSEGVIATLQPEVRPYARALVSKAAGIGITIKVISGLRTYSQQNELYAQGRTKPGRVVTNARGGYSNHNFGIAFDIGVFEGAKYLDESPKYKAVGALGVELGLEWGGNWKTIQDQPHFQLRPTWAGSMAERDMLAELRARADSGRGFYV